ncbi:hypothetical protein ACFL6S_36230 [Candidatus Poribacteria bacterium]
MSSEWVSMKQACDTLEISISTLRRRIENRNLESKLEGNRRLVLIHHDTSSDTSTKQEATQTDTSFVEQLKYQIESLQKQLDTREGEVANLQEELSQSRERSDTIILQLTRQMEQSQRLLEYHEEPWYRRMFRKKQKTNENLG